MLLWHKSQHYKTDIKRVLKAVKIPFKEEVFNQLFKPTATFDTGYQGSDSVFEVYNQLLTECCKLR